MVLASFVRSTSFTPLRPGLFGAHSDDSHCARSFLLAGLAEIRAPAAYPVVD